ncbi:hypothetical protein SAMN04488490_3010 [Marinobacter sp. LV10R510-11A]|nr:hypothetical protein SAMN04488490_3010 [Marinobacter sp. LV10R510-11A]
MVLLFRCPGLVNQCLNIREDRRGIGYPGQPAQRNAAFPANAVQDCHRRPDDPGPPAGITPAMDIGANGLSKTVGMAQDMKDHRHGFAQVAGASVGVAGTWRVQRGTGTGVCQALRTGSAS